ncbi:MAG: hypothetical protein H7240_00425 [Glaciimonas sp.]|nr:hypothetical protein [Glaciimonas sp.]
MMDQKAIEALNKDAHVLVDCKLRALNISFFEPTILADGAIVLVQD